MRAHRPLSMLIAPGTDLGSVCVGLDATNVAAGNLARFELIFKLTSDVNSNYLHIHTLKGIAMASRVGTSAPTPPQVY